MKRYIHVIVNFFLLILFFLVAELAKRDFFTVPEMLDIGKLVDILIVLITVHLLFVIFVVKSLKILNVFVCIITLLIYIFYPVSFNPF